MTEHGGRFIVVEGIDGCGSTTQVARLVASLSARGLDARATAEPTDGPVGRLIRAALASRLVDGRGAPRPPFDWATFALLFAADRADHVEREIAPALAAGAWVVSDRYDLSSLAYQSATAAEGADAIAWIRALNRCARRPDLTLVLDVAPTVAAARRRDRGAAAELFEVDALQRRLAELYARPAELVPGDRVIRLGGEGTPEQVAAALLATVDAWVAEGTR